MKTRIIQRDPEPDRSDTSGNGAPTSGPGRARDRRGAGARTASGLANEYADNYSHRRGSSFRRFSSGGERPGWSAGRVVAVVFGSLGALIGLVLLLAGLALVLAHAFAPDDDG